jgi:hypothetical protein
MKGVQPQPRPEVELTRQLLAGDAQAFDRFVDLFRSRIFQYSFLMWVSGKTPKKWRKRRC